MYKPLHFQIKKPELLTSDSIEICYWINLDSG